MLKQTPIESRTLFLKLFAKELISKSKPKIEVEIKKVEETKKITEIEGLEKPEIKKEEVVEKKETTKEISELTKPIGHEKLIPSILLPTKPKVEIPKPPIKNLTGPLKPITMPLTSHPSSISASIEPSKFTMPISGIPEIEGEVNLGKLNMFLMDSAVTEIECPGPGKFVLLRKVGQVNITKITLTQKEISEIVESFSKQARIPLISGVFKASIGNLTITAIISEFVGSRFIIYKASPYSLIEQQARQLHQAQLQGRLLYNKRKDISPFL